MFGDWFRQKVTGYNVLVKNVMQMMCRNARGRLVAGVLIWFLWGAAALAQDQDQGGVLRASVNLVMVDATVKTKAGQILGDLKQKDFELREDGVEQNVQIFSRDELPLNEALVLVF